MTPQPYDKLLSWCEMHDIPSPEVTRKTIQLILRADEVHERVMSLRRMFGVHDLVWDRDDEDRIVCAVPARYLNNLPTHVSFNAASIKQWIASKTGYRIHEEKPDRIIIWSQDVHEAAELSRYVHRYRHADYEFDERTQPDGSWLTTIS